MLTVCLSASAAQENVLMSYLKKDNSNQNSERNRMPIRLPIEVVYDSEERTVCVTSDCDINAEVYLYDYRGCMIAHSTGFGVTMAIPTTGYYTVYIDSESWYAEGSIEVE